MGQGDFVEGEFKWGRHPVPAQPFADPVAEHGPGNWGHLWPGELHAVHTAGDNDISVKEIPPLRQMWHRSRCNRIRAREESGLGNTAHESRGRRGLRFRPVTRP